MAFNDELLFEEDLIEGLCENGWEKEIIRKAKRGEEENETSRKCRNSSGSIYGCFNNKLKDG
jgi:hypothetical protein